MASSYYAPTGGHPGQQELLTGRAVFTEAYAVIPRGVMRDIVVSFLPHWELTRLWVLARPLSGFAETFSQYIVEVLPNGGSDRPETDASAEAVLFVVDGELDLTVDGTAHRLSPAATRTCRPARRGPRTTPGPSRLRFHWIRKAYERVDGLDTPPAFVTHERDAPAVPMPGTEGAGPRRASSSRATCATTCTSTSSRSSRARDPVRRDPRHGARPLRPRGQGGLPAQPGLGRGRGRRLHVAARLLPAGLLRGRAGPFRYLLYKDVNRHVRLPTSLR
jgi:(S)-ureidoglycine aminohydrolase